MSTSIITIHLGTAGNNKAPASENHNSVYYAPNLQQAVEWVNNNNYNQWDRLHVLIPADELSTAWSIMELANLKNVNRSTQTLTIEVVPSNNNNNNNNLQPIHNACLLAGLSVTGERKTDRGSVVLTAQKANVVVSNALLLNNNTNNKDTTVEIEEDDLLEQEGDWKPNMTNGRTANNKDDCGGREPCADCTCGRRSDNDGIQQQQQQQTSACGKCGLGDAFRCASCPYLGRPAFKAGEEQQVLLDLTDDF